MSTRLASWVWLGWVAVLAATTAGVFKWHLDYFSSPGPQFHRIAMVFIPALALAAWIYAAARRKSFRYEPHLLAILIVAACLFYEPRAALVSGAFFLACTCAGRAVLPAFGFRLASPLDRIVVGFGAGAAMSIPLLFVLGLANWFYPAVFLGILIAPAVVFFKEVPATIRDFRAVLSAWETSAGARHPLTGAAIAFGAVAAVCSLMVVLAPSISFDSVAMHLPLAQFYASQHALTPLPGLDYGYYPQGMEVLWALAFSLAGQAGARLLSGLFFGAFLAMLFRIGRMCGLDGGTALTGVIFAAMLPFLHWTGSVVKNDLALGFFEALALYAFLQWLDLKDFRLIVAGAFFLSQAFAVKLVAFFGALPLILLFGYAVWQQRRRWTAACALTAILLVFGACWGVRTYWLTGNPVYPETLNVLGRGAIEVKERAAEPQVRHYAAIPYVLMFQGENAFESPLSNPAGILLLALAPAAFLAGPLRNRIRRMTPAQIAFTVFAGLNLLAWAWFVTKVRYAVLPFGMLAMAAAAWAMRFYNRDSADRILKVSLLAVETYALLIALMGLMIIGVNGPQIAYFRGQLDRGGYLRAAMHAYPAVEFLNASAGPHPRIFGVDNVARGYASDPGGFEGMVCRTARYCGPKRITSEVWQYESDYLIVPAAGLELPETIRALGNPESIYHDSYFIVYDLRKTHPAIRR